MYPSPGSTRLLTVVETKVKPAPRVLRGAQKALKVTTASRAEQAYSHHKLLVNRVSLIIDMSNKKDM